MYSSLPKRLTALAALALFCAGCSNPFDRTPVPPCPPIFVLKDAGSLTKYKPGAGQDIIDVLYSGKVINFQGTCDFNKERTEVEIKLELYFELMRGPANRDRKAAFKYFIAIPHFHPAPQGKNVFSLEAAFEDRATRAVARARSVKSSGSFCPVKPRPSCSRTNSFRRRRAR